MNTFPFCADWSMPISLSFSQITNMDSRTWMTMWSLVLFWCMITVWYHPLFARATSVNVPFTNWREHWKVDPVCEDYINKHVMVPQQFAKTREALQGRVAK